MTDNQDDQVTILPGGHELRPDSEDPKNYKKLTIKLATDEPLLIELCKYSGDALVGANFYTEIGTVEAELDVGLPHRGDSALMIGDYPVELLAYLMRAAGYKVEKEADVKSRSEALKRLGLEDWA